MTLLEDGLVFLGATGYLGVALPVARYRYGVRRADRIEQNANYYRMRDPIGNFDVFWRGETTGLAIWDSLWWPALLVVKLVSYPLRAVKHYIIDDPMPSRFEHNRKIERHRRQIEKLERDLGMEDRTGE